MGICLPAIVHHATKILRPRSLQNHQSSSSPVETTTNVPKGHFAVYVGESQKNRFVVPISYLKHPLFQDLLRRAEEESGFDHPMGGLTIPCSEAAFLNIFTSHLN
uniref:Putative auxin-induced protein 15A-like n=1 Tax=Davidia involucrata TaxID=16924 RepID=A0A5B6YQB6_DAVIN